ncbi:MAG TPA: nicotinamide-nucleotide amidohydrolase family protein [Opitutaceae bacterium]|nr:nicotinamide-nucleotide amidohydrolase family protein [Opitutaceae bacterium]
MKDLKELMLRTPRLTLAAAESMTCGRVQARIGEISGASEFFLGGVTTYTIDEKVRHLGVSRAEARHVNCVSAGIVEQMAQGVCALFRSDIGVATTGYAEPDAALDVKSPFAWWAVAHRKSRGSGRFVRIATGRIECPGASRVEAQVIVAEAVVGELVAYLWELRE